MAPSDGDSTRPPLPFGERATEAVTAAVTPPLGLGAFPASPSSGPLAPGEAFGPRYHIIKLLGAGGMGAVYQAWDQELGIAVALKVIRPEAIADLQAAEEMARRFKRELLLARQVTHKNVVRIHDLGEIDGIKYITMSYVEGEDLATVLRREGKLGIKHALNLARQILAGLAAAHEAGVIHRDLKPANIMLDADDNAMIMDFGIARSDASPVQAPPLGHPSAAAALGTPLAASQSLPSREDQETLWTPPAQGAVMATLAGAVMGTVGYMAPEQALAKTVDHRADIYAFGLILTEMLVGRAWRSTDLTPEEELFARIEKGLPSIRSYDPEIPAPVEELISRCLQIDADARFATTRELVEALDRLDDDGQVIPLPKSRANKFLLSTAAALFVTVVSGAVWFAMQPAPPPPQRDPVSVLVADFENRTGDPVFDGAVEQGLSLGIEGASFITAYPRRDAQRTADEIKPGSRLGEEVARLVSVREGIKVVLAGSISGSGGGYEVAVKAVDPASGKLISSAKRSASSKDAVLAAVGWVSGRMRRALGDTEPEKAGAREMFTAASLEAARHYSVAQDLQTNYKDEEAIRYYKQATELDPDFGRAYGGWAHSAFRLGRQQEAEQAWKKSLSLIDRMTEREKYRTLGIYYGTVTRNYEKAIETYSTLVELYPADGAGHNNLALAYFNTLNFQKALEAGRRVLEIYPRKLLYQGNYALYAMYAGDFGAAESQSRQIVEQNPGYYPAYLPLAMAGMARGEPSAAQDAYERMAKTGAAGSSIAAMGLADLSLHYGRLEEAMEKLKEGIAEDERHGNRQGLTAKWTALAEVYAAGGRRAEAVAAAERALQLAGPALPAVPAARVLIALGREDRAVAVAAQLGPQLQPHSRAYAKILEGEIALKQRRPIEAVEAFKSAQKITDLWLARLLLGIAYIESNYHAEALSELELCQKRRGDASAILLDDMPSFRYLGPLQYWLGRAHEGLGATDKAAEYYETYVALRPDPSRDPLAADARGRLASR